MFNYALLLSLLSTRSRGPDLYTRLETLQCKEAAS